MMDSGKRLVGDFSGVPSRPRAGRGVRVVVLLLLLALALGAIWFIDRGAMLTNSHSTPAGVGGK